MGVSESGVTRDYVHSLAEELDGEFSSSILDASREMGISVVYTLFLREKGRVYNVAVFAEKGVVRVVYRKIHLFDAYGYRESEIFASGKNLAVVDFKNFRIGLAVCFDLRFPELFRALAYRGVNLFIVPAAWYRGKYKLDQWRHLIAARAHENTSYLVAVDQVGKFFLGHSLVASPLGFIRFELGEKEEKLSIELEKGELEEAEKLVPVRKLWKRNLYSKWLERL